MGTPEPARVVELALAVASEPLSIDTLVSWNVVRPGELWSFLSAAEADGRIDQPQPGQFAFANAARRDEALSGATPEDWGALLVSPERIGWALGAARAAAKARRFSAANDVFRAVVAAEPREAFPGGARAWLGAVLEGLRLNRGMYGVSSALYADALRVAVAEGDLGAQGVLRGTIAATLLRDGKVDDADEHLALAREAARACSGPVAAEIAMYVAIGLVFQGRLEGGVDAFEELLGDLPEDVSVLVHETSPAPALSLLILSIAYCGTGQAPRALDLIHRIRAFGVERNVPLLEHQADLFAAMAHEAVDAFEVARPHAERAYAFYAGTRTDPLHLWFAATSLAVVRAWEGRLSELPPILACGLDARRRAGWPLLPGTRVVQLLEQLEIDGISIEGFELGAEIERMLAGPSLFWRGVGHRFLARRLARSQRDEADPGAVRLHLERSVALLREAGAAPELERALADAAGLARGAGRDDEAARLEAELLRASARSPSPNAPDGDGHARMIGVLLELGRLGSLAERREGTWGEIAARLCRALGAERCAIVEAGDSPRLLGVRGGSDPWREALLALLGESGPRTVQTFPAPASAGEPTAGRLLVVPFAAEGRAGWACLENRYGRPAVGPEDGPLLDVLSVQLGVLLGNVALWQQLAAAREKLAEENRYWRSTRAATSPGSRIVGDSPALRAALDLVARVAPATTPVLVHGETGVGKELVASEIHRLSPRRQGPFIPVHVASLAPGLVASGLFGHERGAFTGATDQAKGRFELADGGTLFLDEVGELSPEDQVRLLRVLQEGTFERVGGARPIRSDFRLVAATHRDLQAEVRAGRFREDLYFRLAAFPIRVPPLRERVEEIPTLALFFMERASRGRGVRFEGIGESDVRRMLEYPWPGNVRELAHVVERAVLLSEPPRLRIPSLETSTRAAPPPAPAPATAQDRRRLATLAEAERRHISEVLHHARGRITGAGGAAEILGMKPSTLNFRIRKLGLVDEVGRARAKRGDGAR